MLCLYFELPHAYCAVPLRLQRLKRLSVLQMQVSRLVSLSLYLHPLIRSWNPLIQNLSPCLICLTILMSRMNLKCR